MLNPASSSPNHPEIGSRLSHVQRENLPFIESLYEQFKKDPNSVAGDWKLFFEGVEFAKSLPDETGHAAIPLSSKALAVFQLVLAYRTYGHLEAQLNPLFENTHKAPELMPSAYGLQSADMAEELPTFGVLESPKAKLQDILDRLRKVYCGTTSAQVTDTDTKTREWITTGIEGQNFSKPLSKEEKITLLEQLVKAEGLEKFLHARFVGAKRFSVEGNDSLYPMLERALVTGRALGMDELVVGMAHRGRLNVLCNFMGKSAANVFAQFEGIGKGSAKGYELDGDVKYHMGYTSERETPQGKVRLSLAFNPSHLEAVNPVVGGMTRAKQRQHRDTLERKKIVPVLVHGDAAFAGQGVVFETLQMSQLRGYRVGGTIHIITNNQVGFTTDWKDSRSTAHPSDVSKGIQAPVLHVNADDAEACLRVMDLALQYRQAFGKDIVINAVGYRRYGHNEGDEPGFTQPRMYAAISKHPTPREVYSRKLEGENTIAAGQGDEMASNDMKRLQAILEDTRKNPPDTTVSPILGGLWQNLKMGKAEDFKRPAKTGTSRDTLIKVGNTILATPQGFNMHPKVKSLVDRRAKMVDGREPIDWGMGELLAYGTLLHEGTPVRLTGQDVVRGTFTHRHAMYFDTQTGDSFNPFNAINPPREFCIYNSLLSEFAVMGFEYGNSITDPTMLTLWEAQFGDFSNGAQIIIDQFLAAGEMKWGQMSGLVLLLPHGYEGQGPEHSSARLERYLQLCAQENMQVCNVTTPAQLFHVLRRQVKRDFRKPLVIMSPKSLLRHPKVVSPMEDFVSGSFQEVIFDLGGRSKKDIENLVLCSGKLFFELEEEREKRADKASSTAIMRIEQFYPFPDEQILRLLRELPSLKRVTWAQEEPQNMGAQFFMMPRLQRVLSEVSAETGKGAIDLRYVGRNFRASPATGYPSVHKAEQTAITQACFE